MENKRKNLIFHLVTTILLTLILGISTAFGWYTVNKTVSATGIQGVTASEHLVVTNHAIFKNEVGEDSPYPDEPNVSGLLTGEVMYYSISLQVNEETVGDKRIHISIMNVDGGDFFADENGNEYTVDGKKFNMCDLYTIQLHSLWNTSKNECLWRLDGDIPAPDDLDISVKSFNRDNNGESKSIATFDLFYYQDWDISEIEEITFVFQINFSTQILLDNFIPETVASKKTLVFNNINVTAEDLEEVTN